MLEFDYYTVRDEIVENFESTDDRDEDIVWQTGSQTNRYNFFHELQCCVYSYYSSAELTIL